MKKGYLYILSAALLWGTLPLICRFIYSAGGDSVSSAAARAYFASLIFIIIFIFKGSFRKIKLRDIPFYILYGICGVGGTFLFYMMAVERLSTAMASILLYTAPAFVILFSRIFYKIKITPIKLVTLFGTLLGASLVVKLYNPSFFTASIADIGIGLLAGISYSMVTVLGEIAKNKAPADVNSGLMIIFGTLIFLFVSPPGTIPFNSSLLIFGYTALAVFGSVLPYLLYLKGLSENIDGGLASIIATIEPVAATVLCAVFFHERLEILQIIGIILVLVSIAVSVKTNK